MDYSFVPQMYQQGLQPGLQEQFRLAKEATPVSQFLKGLMSQRQLQMHQQQLDQMAQRWNEDRDYRVNRDAINDQRYRDIAAQNSEDRQMAIKQHADAARERATSKLFEDYSNYFDGSPEMAAHFKPRFEALGIPMPGVHKNQELKARYSYESNTNFTGPQTPAQSVPGYEDKAIVDIPDETYSPGAGWLFKKQAEERKKQYGDRKLDITEEHYGDMNDRAIERNQNQANNIGSMIGHRSALEGIAQGRLALMATPEGRSMDRAMSIWGKLKASNDKAGIPTPDFQTWLGKSKLGIGGGNPRPSAVAPAPSPAPAAQSTGPKVGDVVKGYRFKGGNPASPSSWEKAE